MKMRKISKVTALGLLATLLFVSGCSGGNEKEEMAAADQLTAEIKGKYAQQEMYEYTDPIYDVERDHMFEFDFNFSAFEGQGFDKWTDLVAVYSDSNFYQPVLTKWDLGADEAGNEKSKLLVSPGRSAQFSVRDETYGGSLHDRGEFADWGNAQQYYIVQYYDFMTKTKLEKPLVTVFTVKTELTQTPYTEFYINDNGIGSLRWNRVKGADYYAIVEYSENPSDPARPYMQTIATTEDTKWEDYNKDDKSKANLHFRTVFGDSEDEQYEANRKLVEDGTLDKEEFVKTSDYNGESETLKSQNKYIAVIAINEETGTSKISNPIDVRQSAGQVTVKTAYYINKGSLKSVGVGEKTTGTVDKEINLLSSHLWVVLGNGRLSQKLIAYDVDNVKETRKDVSILKTNEDGSVQLDDAGNPIVDHNETIPVLSIPISVEGTSIQGYAEVENYDKKTFKKELTALKERQDNLKEKTGTVNKNTNIDESEDEASFETAESLRSTQYEVFASNALSEYLAIQMLNGQQKINLDDFKEASDSDYLLDAWYEAIYQNPLTLGVKGIRYDTKGNNVIISYDDDATTQRKKQQEIQTKVTEIVKDIIKDDMTDLEKEEAINRYLCEHAEYDTAALKNAEKNNFEKVDEKFNDSFTAYGILINEKGVCASYAAAFKLLADEAGLESIVVTGNLDGSLPHAWNRVKIGEEWLSLDVTNNDNDYIKNSLFNVPDSLSNKVLVEDDLYVVNTELVKYVATSEDSEYYHYNNQFYSMDQVVDQLVQQYEKDGKALLRTNYSLSDEEFYNIAKQVIEKTGNENLKGTYYLGVIYLSK